MMFETKTEDGKWRCVATSLKKYLNVTSSVVWNELIIVTAVYSSVMGLFLFLFFILIRSMHVACFVVN